MCDASRRQVDLSVSVSGEVAAKVACRPLDSARDEFCRFDRMVQKFPGNAALNRARSTAYRMWIRAVRNWRNGL